MRNFKDIRKLAERHDPEDYKREVDSDAEVKDWEPRSKREKEFVGKHDVTKRGYPKETDAFKSDLKPSSPDGNNAGGEKKPVFQGKKYSDVKKKIKEEVEEVVEETIEEAINPGNLKLNDGSIVNVSSSDAKLLNSVISSLNPENRKRMESEMRKDKKSFEKMMTFAKNQD